MIAQPVDKRSYVNARLTRPLINFSSIQGFTFCRACLHDAGHAVVGIGYSQFRPPSTWQAFSSKAETCASYSKITLKKCRQRKIHFVYTLSHP